MGLTVVKDDWSSSPKANSGKPVTSILETTKQEHYAVTWDATQLELRGLNQFSKKKKILTYIAYSTRKATIDLTAIIEL